MKKTKQIVIRIRMPTIENYPELFPWLDCFNKRNLQADSD
jgi:hypothetical protein